MEFNDIDTFDLGPKQTTQALGARKQANTEQAWHPEKLENGKWACNHKCRDKTM